MLTPLDNEWFATACDAVNDDNQFARLSKHFNATLLLEFGDDQYIVDATGGSIDLREIDPRFTAWDIAIRASVETWEKMLDETPPPLYHDPLATWLEAGDLNIEGDLPLALRHTSAIKRLFTVFRRVRNGESDSPKEEASLPPHGTHEPITGRYVWLDVHDETYRTHYEVAGDGDIPLVCLHTASGDVRQWRHLLNDASLHDDLTIYAFDMPWHGNSYPPLSREWWIKDYTLTGPFFKDFIMTFVRTLGLDSPILMGCSMAAKVVLELAIEYPDELEAVISVEGADHRPRSRDFGYLSRPDINQEVVRPEWTYALQAPQSPERNKRESWWIYSQGGTDVYVGDLPYSGTMDIREEIKTVNTDECGVYFLTGEYDFSTTPQETRRTAEKVDGAYLDIMEGVGHFPQIENPDVFRQALTPVFEDILE
ncbi:alpha/beta fold hydrolase [Halegenticoccus tardaugens]|uniref:alpha/beta fold hydrolase n=1 Tax=Halegenticoccus tardaugens TaxID=2071624 RepID=UPI00100A8C09|nr:alpha/beta hydrolase [Halegenticoccus tardaugens]